VKKLICLFLGALVSTSSMAANWEYVATNVRGSSFYIDRSSIDNNGSYTKVWVKMLYKKTRKSTEPNDIEESMTLHEISCPLKKQHMLSMHFYKFDGSSDNYDASTEWEYIVPDSLFESIMQKVCK
jgi:hypothetical protein